MDRIDAMRVFVTVVQEKGFARAAERLDMSPQLASKSVAQLEDKLACRLLNRTTRRVHLTEAGRGYYLRVQQVLADIDEMESHLTDMQQEARGELRISAPVSFAIGYMGALVNDFQQAHPGVSVDMQLNDRKVDIIDEGFDIALRIGHLKNSSLIAKRIAPVRLLYAASPEYLSKYGAPKSLSELKQHRLLRYSYMENDQDWQGSQTSAIAMGQLQSNNGDVLVQAAIQGGGIVLQPSFLLAQALQHGQLEVVLADCAPEPLGLYAVYAHRQLLASKVRCFIDFIDGYYGSPPVWDI